MEYLPSYTDGLYLAHHGIKGQKWGVRRYQNLDGSLTPEGRKHYNVNSMSTTRAVKKAYKNSVDANRQQVRSDLQKAWDNDKVCKSLTKSLKKTQRDAYQTFADIYNNHAKEYSNVKPLDRKKFNALLDYMDLDDKVIDDTYRDPRFDKVRQYSDKHRDMSRKLDTRKQEIAQQYVDKYNQALLNDIPNDGSSRAVNKIIKRYGTDALNLSYDGRSIKDESNPNYGFDALDLWEV